MSTNNTLRISPESQTYAKAQASDYPLAYAIATHAGTGILRRDKSLQWRDALQTTAMALLESGHDPCRNLPADGRVSIPAGLVSVIKRTLKLQASPENGLSRGRDSHESAERKKTRDRIAKLAKRLQSNPMSIAAKAIDYGLFPKLNAFDIYRRLADVEVLDHLAWRRAISYATPKISAKGIASLAEARGTSPIKSVIYGPDGPAPSVSHWSSDGASRKSFPANNFTPIRILATKSGLRVFRDELDLTSLPAY
jgi:hypothetical protein